MSYDPYDVHTWPYYKPLLIAHDVGHRRDRSTAVIGGNSPYGPQLLGIGEAEELPQGLFGSARASALAAIDRRYHSNALIIADITLTRPTPRCCKRPLAYGSGFTSRGTATA
jgi:hypothetical protein